MPGSSAHWPRCRKSLKLQKICGVSCQEPGVKHAFSHRHRQAFSIQRMCKHARSRSQRLGEAFPRRRQQAFLDQRVGQAYQRGKGFAPRRRASSRRRRTRDPHCRWRSTCWSQTSPPWRRARKGRRRHLSINRGRMTLLGGADRPVLTQGVRVGDERPQDG